MNFLVAFACISLKCHAYINTTLNTDNAVKIPQSSNDVILPWNFHWSGADLQFNCFTYTLSHKTCICQLNTIQSLFDYKDVRANPVENLLQEDESVCTYHHLGPVRQWHRDRCTQIPQQRLKERKGEGERDTDGERVRKEERDQGREESRDNLNEEGRNMLLCDTSWKEKCKLTYASHYRHPQ